MRKIVGHRAIDASARRSHPRTRKPKAVDLHPARSVVVVTELGVTQFGPEEVSSSNVGHKAYGLTSLPAEWVPPFFVIKSSSLDCSDSAIDSWTAEACSLAEIDTKSTFLVRSSGTLETIRHRGRLISGPCSPSEVSATIRKLTQKLPAGQGGEVHWIVQQQVDSKRKGQLSNERRVSYESRDWVAEFELNVDRIGFAEPIAIRKWRDGDFIDLDLTCGSELGITVRLKRIAMWAMTLSSRALLEWVWDGSSVYVVQIDLAETPAGVDPRRMLPKTIPALNFPSLQLFRSATATDYETYGKLRNAKAYEGLGYKMPPFYVIDGSRSVRSILSGRIPRTLQNDLAELTRRSLVIRTDGLKIPSDQREMLPRSEELRSYSESREWLVNVFASQIKELGLQDAGICLIAHHFIPSTASAWARAVPGYPLVSVESLWGIPEGLYWYSHDAYEVDTQTVEVDLRSTLNALNYKISDHRLRYKGTFIAPDTSGKWIRHQTRPPSDWNASIHKKESLFEIARTTRALAEKEKRPTSVMWFIGNHAEASTHEVLPWFHCKSELTGPPKAAPRQKYKKATDYRLGTTTDWVSLRQRLNSGERITRVVVDPVDAELIRNPRFARELAELAALNNFVVELSGGILSHVFHILQSKGAQVECADLFGAREEVIEYDKVVRDKIPNQIKRRGERVEIVKLREEALQTALLQKLIEEAFEAQDAKSGEALVGELADVTEVIRGLCLALKIDHDEVEIVREKKLKRRGGFKNGLMLIRTSAPSLSQESPWESEAPTLNLTSQPPDELIISDASGLPSKPFYRRPDLRQVEQQFEKLFTFETEISGMAEGTGREVKEAMNFSMPLGDQTQEFTLTVEVSRVGSSIRGVVRLRPGPFQLRIEFPVPDSQLRIFPK